LTRPAGALLRRVTGRSLDTDAEGNPHRHRNHRLAWDIAVGTAALALVLVLHHQFRRSPRPIVAAVLAGSPEVVADQPAPEARPTKPAHRRPRPTEQPVARLEGNPPKSEPGLSVAKLDDHRDFDTLLASKADAGLGDQPQARRADLPVQPPTEVQAKAAPLEQHPHDSKHEADAGLDSLLSAPVVSSPAPHAEPAAPMAQTEPAPSHDLDKPVPAHHSNEPLLVDSREPNDSAHPAKRNGREKAVEIGSRHSEDFAAPVAEEHHKAEEHRKHDHGPKDEGLKDDFSMPAPTAPSSAQPTDSPALKDDATHHLHHHADHDRSDHSPSGDAPRNDKDADLLGPVLDRPQPDSAHSKPSDAPRANDPLLDVGPKLDGPKDTPISAPSMSDRDKGEPKKPDRPDDLLPVLSVPSPHKSDAGAADPASKTDGAKIDDLGVPPRTANASDGSIGGSAGLGQDLPAKPADKPDMEKTPSKSPPRQRRRS
jgi:hypothetical protein